MSKVGYWMAVSLGGFAETRDGKIDWTAPNDELHRFSNESALPVSITSSRSRRCRGGAPV